jgi:hypothetical protein
MVNVEVLISWMDRCDLGGRVVIQGRSRADDIQVSQSSVGSVWFVKFVFGVFVIRGRDT